ncbi:universal stress protein [Longibacter salinarum]|uniref:Universal stress protein n=1 Tax=Longibacter salinarum TaxID=1850348 RepID=A0A2A8D2V4_9BACT|nr:universal stress protein [Longibacter salinarum]PEN15220.1 universal stress protein [Longibacter salinarum]
MLNVNSILLARDFSPVSNQAFRYTLDFAQRTGATLHVLYAQVLHEDPTQPGEELKPAGDINEIRRHLSLHADGKKVDRSVFDVEIKEAVVRDVAAAPAILNYASEHDIDMIGLGTHGRRGLRRFLLGSVAEEVVRRADRPVLTVRGEEDEARTEDFHPAKKILVPIDFSDPSREALRYGLALGALYDASVEVLHVIEQKLHPAFYVGGVTDIRDIDPNIEKKVKERLQKFIDETVQLGAPVPGGPDAEAASVPVRSSITPHVIVGTVDTEVPAFIDENDVDLVAMSTKGQTGLDRVLLGSVAEKIVRLSSCPVLTVKSTGKSLVEPNTRN